MPAAYVDVPTAKRHNVLSRVDTTHLTALLEAASDWIDNYTDRVYDIAAPVRPWDTAAATEVYDGNGCDKLYLMRVPVSAISAIVITDSGGSDETLSQSNPDYTFNPQNGAVQFGPDNGSGFGVFPSEFQQNVSVTYTAGYTTTPDWLEQVTVLVALQMHKQTAANANASFQEEKLGDHTMKRVMGTEALATPLIKSILDLHRRTEF